MPLGFLELFDFNDRNFDNGRRTIGEITDLKRDDLKPTLETHLLITDCKRAAVLRVVPEYRVLDLPCQTAEKAVLKRCNKAFRRILLRPRPTIILILVLCISGAEQNTIVK